MQRCGGDARAPPVRARFPDPRDAAPGRCVTVRGAPGVSLPGDHGKGTSSCPVRLPIDRSIRYTLATPDTHPETPMNLLPIHGAREQLSFLFFTLLIATTFLF